MVQMSLPLAERQRPVLLHSLVIAARRQRLHFREAEFGAIELIKQLIVEVFKQGPDARGAFQPLLAQLRPRVSASLSEGFSIGNIVALFVKDHVALFDPERDFHFWPHN
jgi:hypothetical protein